MSLPERMQPTCRQKYTINVATMCYAFYIIVINNDQEENHQHSENQDGEETPTNFTK